MKAHRVIGLLAAASALVLAGTARAASVDASERLVPRERLQQVVDVRDVAMSDDGNLTGIVVNRSDKPVKDVQLVVKYMWLWDHEFHPGEDGPGRAVFVNVPGEIPPGGQVRFTYRPESPLQQRADGHFSPAVQVASVTEISTVADTARTVPETYAAPPAAAARPAVRERDMGTEDEPAAIR